MKTIKQTLAVGVALLTLAFTAEAQLGVPPTIIDFGTNVVVGADLTTNAMGSGGIRLTNWPVAVIDCTGSKEVSLECSFKLLAAGTVAQSIYIAKSDTPAFGGNAANLTKAGGVPWDTIAPIIWGITPNGTTPVTAHTNISVLGTPYLYITIITNGSGASAVLTNFVLKAYNTKR